MRVGIYGANVQLHEDAVSPFACIRITKSFSSASSGEPTTPSKGFACTARTLRAMRSLIFFLLNKLLEAWFHESSKTGVNGPSVS